jgi:biopolymer transport protein ExbD
MAQTLGTSTKGSVNVELNIVPFIDLMSCLTAFLLVSAVWVNIAQLTTHPQGRTRDAPPGCTDDNCPPQLSVLLESDDIWVGISRVNDFQRIPKTDRGYDWDKLASTLQAHKTGPYFQTTDQIEIAASSTSEHPINYESLVTAMDIAVKSGFGQVGLTEPNSLSARPTL